jgi:tRNA-binding EMAP/Myf-like protein
MTIDLGPLGKRTIVAGMRPYYTTDEITNKHIVVVLNLKPAKIRGIESNGMLLAATDPTGTVTLLNPQDATPGAEVYIDGIPREPAGILEFNEFTQINMTINQKQEATYNNQPLRTKTNTIITDKQITPGSAIS